MYPRTALLMAALMVAMAPASVANPYGANCADPSTYHTVANGGPFDDVQCLTIVGPGSIDHKSLAGAGLGLCNDEAGSPFPCNDPTAPQSGFGAAIFDASTWPAGNKMVSTWVRYLGNGVCGPAVLDACGFEVLLCNDRDLDVICNTTGDDEILRTQSNEPLVGGGYLVCTPPCQPVMPTIGGDCTDEDKDLKDCPDPLAAEVGGVMTPALQPPAPADWNHGQIMVLVGNWVDSWPGEENGAPTNIGAGISFGHYEVWLGMIDLAPPPPPPPPQPVFIGYDP
jgi:hypothetical protein